MTRFNEKDVEQFLAYVKTELRRVETAAGTLAMIERSHHQRLSDYDDAVLRDIAVEEDNAAKRLGAIKEMCLAACQRIDDLLQGHVRPEAVAAGEGREERAPVH
ncbi:hypothetical protein CVV65_06445 [Kyrpidia spormannii]|uniref:Uncharacterized protein n=1 Tax=Kyrpidia spormannii TaxID=2055160 RepID=A0A2K8N751_9BACL|nr:hypothetical protein [Kyrpidia spormannii]ATY84627.1 hypothetical protein CVV65_06445 [Kyrpidia spormannii]